MLSLQRASQCDTCARQVMPCSDEMSPTQWRVHTRNVLSQVSLVNPRHCSRPGWGHDSYVRVRARQAEAEAAMWRGSRACLACPQEEVTS